MWVGVVACRGRTGDVDTRRHGGEKKRMADTSEETMKGSYKCRSAFKLERRGGFRS